MPPRLEHDLQGPKYIFRCDHSRDVPFSRLSRLSLFVLRTLAAHSSAVHLRPRCKRLPGSCTSSGINSASGGHSYTFGRNMDWKGSRFWNTAICCRSGDWIETDIWNVLNGPGGDRGGSSVCFKTSYGRDSTTALFSATAQYVTTSVFMRIWKGNHRERIVRQRKIAHPYEHVHHNTYDLRLQR